MYKSSDHWRNSPAFHDSESENAVLLSSDSHFSDDQVMFRNSELSELDSSPTCGSSRYGSVGASSFSSTVTIVPRRLPPMVQNHITIPASHITSTLKLSSEKKYKIHNIDLLIGGENYETLGVQPIKKEYITSPLSHSLPLELNTTITSEGHAMPKQSSLVTIFSIWNTILGSSLLTMPWGISMAGFFPGIILILLMSGLCLYTAYLLLQVHQYYGGDEKIEVTQLSRIYLNKLAESVSRIFSMTVLLGATVAYWILMSNFFYNSVNFIYDNIASIPAFTLGLNESYPPDVLCPKNEFYNGTHMVMLHESSYSNLGPAWDLYRTVPLFLALLVFPLLNFNSTTFFTKFNSLGTASIFYIIIFVLIKSMSWGINMDRVEWEGSWILRPTFPALSGMLALSFFIHNIIITIMQSNRDQRNNGRDLVAAYTLVTITYVIIGVTFYLCFPLAKSCIEDNLLNNFQTWDGLTVGARIVLLFQLLTVYPLLTYMLRIQVLSSMCKTASTRSMTLIINVIVMLICVLFAMFVPRIGTIIRYTGALSGLIYVFTLPCLLHIAVLKKQGKLTTISLLLHLIIPFVGGSNLLAQFFIKDR